MGVWKKAAVGVAAGGVAAVIPVDYMTFPAEDFWKITPDMTVTGGDVLYTRPVGAGS